VKNLNYYLGLRYTIVVRPLTDDEGGGWFAEIPLLHGCWADGETPDSALAELSKARVAWMESMLASKKFIPIP
jgi:antitoxin HicB